MAATALARFVRSTVRLCGAEHGSTAVEFALLGSIFVVLMLNVVDCALLIWTQMEVDYAAEVGAQAAFKSCATGQMPATTNCSSLSSAVQTAVQSTLLGTAVALASNSPSEGYYCATSSNVLQSVGTYNSPPSPYDCTSAGDPSATPGDYLTVNVSYPFAPLFAGLSYIQGRTLSASGMQRLQ